MAAESTTLADAYRQSVKVARQADGGIILRGPRSMLLLSPVQVDQLISFASDGRVRPRIQRYVAPELPLPDYMASLQEIGT